VIFGQLTNPALGTIGDLVDRESLIFAPLILATLALGFQPGLVFGVTREAATHLVDVFHAATGR
jgi:NADH:ubiquinone oxidoreductase subunit 4 (subunit M)